MNQSKMLGRLNRASIDSIKENQDIITLNIGGELFMTYRSTIVDSESTLLRDLVKEKKLQQGQMTLQDHFFIDRNGDLFRDMMYYFRTQCIYTRDLKKLAALKEEAGFYQLDTMIHDLEKLIDEVKLKQEKEQKKPKVILKDVKEMYKTIRDTKAAHPTTYKIIEEKSGVEQTYSVLDIVYVRDINTCFEHGKAYCSCSSTPKLVLIPKVTD